MGAIVGAVVGYLYGSRVGKDGHAELKQSWETIRTSEEVRGMLAGGISIAGGLVQRGGQLLIDRLQGSSSSSSASTRRAA